MALMPTLREKKMGKTNEKKSSGMLGITIIVLAIAVGAGLWVREQNKGEAVIETESVSREEIPVPEFPYMRAACLEYMSMRETPGLNGTVVERIYPATLLEWLGDKKEAEGIEFYLVRNPETGNQGYCSARYCIPVEYLYEESGLDVVNTSEALYTYAQMAEDLALLEEKYPEAISLQSLGTSVLGREIYQVILGNPSANKAVFIQGGIHGREYMSSQLVMKMIEYYAAFYGRGYYKDSYYDKLFDEVAFYIVPMSNPDGVSISQLGESAAENESVREMMRAAYARDKETLIYMEDTNGDYMWYDAYKWKNFSKEASGYPDIISYEDYLEQWKANAGGVDINRNFDAQWEGIQQKELPGGAFFKGYQANSEPETQILMEAMNQRSFEFVISYHARGQLIYYDTLGISAELSRKSLEFASTCEDLIGYRIVNTKDSASVEMGGFSDWIMLEKNIPAITIEMGKRPCPLLSDEFIPIWVRNRELWAKLAWEMM